MADDGGVLGNLPRSRPGHRSEKRTGTTGAKAADRAERTEAEAATPAAEEKPPPPAPPAGEDRARAGEAPPAREGDLVGDAVRTVTGVAATGARVATGVAREVLRRLPRP
jgi:hypothetical protein